MFVLFISETKLARTPGLSAAGANLEVLPYTAPADVDLMFYDMPKVIDCVPLDPFGHPTPAIVTKAALLEGKFPITAVRAGTSIAPVAPFLELTDIPGEDPRETRAVVNVDEINKKAVELAKKIGADNKLIVIGESVPGGTTTALLLLRALGYNGMVSSAAPDNPCSIKEEIWSKVSARLGIEVGALKGKGLEAAAEVGDPMQIAVASFVSALPDDVEVVLAGGTQMSAVAALIRDMGITRPLLIATSKYIIEDKSSCFIEYAEKAGVEWYAAPLDLSGSKYTGLSDYEKGFVKEGVGMGGAVWYAIKNGATMKDIIDRIEHLYEGMIS